VDCFRTEEKGKVNNRRSQNPIYRSHKPLSLSDSKSATNAFLPR
jgi:hypothetical protein